MPIDHLVYAVHDLDEGIASIEEKLGVRPVKGGSHPGWGTQNALLGLGDGRYLEIIAPDPRQQVAKRPLGVDGPDLPRLTTWAWSTTNLEQTVERAKAAGIDLGEIKEMSRGNLSWRLTDPFADRMDGVIPFFIEWGDSRHPSETAPENCYLHEVRIRHPQAEQLYAKLRAIASPPPFLLIGKGEPEIRASIAHTPSGVFVL